MVTRLEFTLDRYPSMVFRLDMYSRWWSAWAVGTAWCVAVMIEDKAEVVINLENKVPQLPAVQYGLVRHHALDHVI